MHIQHFKQELAKIDAKQPIQDYSDYTAAQLSMALERALRAQNFAVIHAIATLERTDKPDIQARLFDAIDKQDWQTLFNIKAALKTEVYLPTQGPRPKSSHTYNIEYILRSLLRGEHFEFIQIGDDYHIQLPGMTFNWTELCNWANFEHVILGPDDFALYTTYLTSKYMPPEAARPSLIAADTAEYQDYLYKTYYESNWPLPEPKISFQEMQAINVYTGDFYQTMNRLLRNELKLDTLPNRTIRAAIINSILCASGLTRIPQTNIKDAYRMGSLKPREHAAQVEAAAVHGVVSLSGFVSTSRNDANLDAFRLKPVHFHIKNPRGMYIACLSKAPGEQEFLMPPTQVQLTAYHYANNKHYFEATVISDLKQLSPESLEPGQAPQAMPNLAFNQVLRELLDKAKTPIMLLEFKDFIQTSDDFAFFMEHADSNQQAALCAYYDGRWDSLIKDVKNAIVVLSYLNIEQTAQFSNAWPHWIKLIHTSQDFGKLMYNLSAEQRAFILPLFNTQWHTLIKTTYDFISIISQLKTEQSAVLFDLFKHDWHRLITSGHQFETLLSKLDINQQNLVITACQSHWHAVVKNASDAISVMECLDHTQKIELFTQFAGEWPKIIINSSQFCLIMNKLDAQERDKLYAEFEGRWGPLIKSNTDFVRIHSELNAVQQNQLFEENKTLLANGMNSSLLFTSTLNTVSPTQATELYIACLQHTNSGFAPSTDDFDALPPTHKSAIYKHLLHAEPIPTIETSHLKPT